MSDLSDSPFLSNAEQMECLDSDNLGADVKDGHAEGVEENEGQTESPGEVAAKRMSLSVPDIEKKYVHKVYDAIAPHFSATRFAKWPKVALFLDSLPPGSLVVDSGCGNGKYLGYNPNCFFIGCDISPPLVAICSRKGHEALVADALHLPYRTGFYDAAISIAVLHHLSNENRRIRAIEELLRVVRSGGKVLITVWAREQEDKGLLKKWTPLSDKYVEEWVNDEDVASGKRHDLASSLERIQEGGDGCPDCNIDTTNGGQGVGSVDIERQDGGGGQVWGLSLNFRFRIVSSRSVLGLWRAFWRRNKSDMLDFGKKVVKKDFRTEDF